MSATGAVLRAVAAVALGSAATFLVPAAPAAADACAASTGVTVVVDFTKLEGGITTDCAAGAGGEKASAILEVHHSLTRTAQYYQVVCRVDGTPSDAPCQAMPPADAYWGLFWSDGDGGWTYSSQSVDTLRVPDGGSVAFAWQDGGGTDQPGVAPPQNAAKPSDDGSPSDSSGGSGRGSGAGSGSGTGPSSGSAAGSPTPTSGTAASPSAASTTGNSGRASGDQDRNRSDRGGGEGKDGRKKGGRDGVATGEEVTAVTRASDDPVDALPASDPSATGDTLPAWLAPASIAALFAAAGAVALVRRRATP